MKRLILLGCSLLYVILFSSCEQKTIPEEFHVTEYATYEDPVTKARILYPARWIVQSLPGKLAFFTSSSAVADRFLQYSTSGADGARIGILFFQMDTTKTLRSYLDSVRVFTDPSFYSEPEQVQIGGKMGYMLKYSVQMEDGLFYGEQYVATADTQIVTVVQMEVFGGLQDAVRPIFDTVLKTLVLGKAPVERPVEIDTVIVEREPFKPDPNFKQFQSEHFSISIPTNFVSNVLPSGKSLYRVKFQGDNGPKDCTVEIDVFDAKNVTNIEKILEDNKSVYEQSGFRILGVKSGKVGTYNARYFEYQYGQNIAGRAYFLLQSGKLFRITVNWYIPEKDIYYPVFMRMLSTFRIS